MGKAKKTQTAMKQTFLIILTLLTLQLEAQEIRPEIKSLAQKIAKYNRLESEHVGFAGETTIQYKNFIELRDKATIEELLELLKYENSVVKGYTSWALADRMYPRLADIFVDFQEKGYSTTTQHGCIISEGSLETEFYNRVFYQHFHNKLSVPDSLFFQSQIQQLDSVILYGKNDSFLMNKALSNNNGNPKNYKRIRELATVNNSKYFLVALAKYQNQNDISFFIEQGKNSFLAISVFPDNKFWDFLQKYSLEEKSLDYFLAISSFKNDSASDLLNNIYKGCNANQIKDLDESLIKNYCIHYQDLLLEIWASYKTIDYTITQRLVVDCPEKASTSFAKGLLNTKENNFIEIDYNYGSKDSILPLMIENIAVYNPSSLNDICINNIKNSKFMELSATLNIVEERQMTDAIPSILERLNKKNVPYEIFHLTETLLSFENDETNLKLVEILKSNRTDWDKGNWSEHFRKLFKEKNIKIE
jgi:hypothetical protein